MCCADTRDVAGTVEQVKRCVDSGAEIVRITVQGKKEAAACMDIREALFKDGCVGASNNPREVLGCDSTHSSMFAWAMLLATA